MRPSGRLTRFMGDTDYQVSSKRTMENSLKKYMSSRQEPLLLAKILHVAPAPFKLLPDNVEERNIGQRGQRQRFLGSANSDCRSSFDSNWRTAVQSQKDRILGVAHFNFDERRFRHDNRSVRENMRANRRNNENPRFRIEDRSAGRKRIC